MLNEELLTIIKSRRSIRKFLDEKVSDEEVYKLIDAARYAPSNSNRQPWKFIVIKNGLKKTEIIDKVGTKLKQIKQLIENEDLLNMFEAYQEYFLFIKDAPVLVIALYKNPPAVLLNLFSTMSLENNNHSSELISVSMAMQNLLLAAHASGLGACLTTGPLVASEEIKELLDIRAPFEIAAVVAVGRYDAEDLQACPPRKSVMDITEVIR